MGTQCSFDTTTMMTMMPVDGSSERVCASFSRYLRLLLSRSSLVIVPILAQEWSVRARFLICCAMRRAGPSAARKRDAQTGIAANVLAQQQHINSTLIPCQMLTSLYRKNMLELCKRITQENQFGRSVRSPRQPSFSIAKQINYLRQHLSAY